MRRTLLLLVSTLVCLNAQNKAKQPGPQACSLLSRAEVEMATGQKSYTEPEPVRGGSGCGYDNAQLLIYTGSDSESQWEATVRAFGHDKAPRTAIAGLGDKAYSLYPMPRDKYEDTSAFVVVKRGNYTIAMSVAAPPGKTAQSVQPQALELAKLVLSRLR